MRTIMLLDKIQKCRKIPGYPSRSRMRELKIVQELVNLLNTTSQSDRWDIVELLGKSFWRYGFVATALSKTLRADRSWLVKVCAAESLGIKRYAEGIPSLIHALKDKHHILRGYAAEALGEIGDKKNKFFLLKCLRHEKSIYVRLKLYGALYFLGDHYELPKIVGFLNSKQVNVRNNAINILLDGASKKNSIIILHALIARLQKESNSKICKLLRDGVRELKTRNICK